MIPLNACVRQLPRCHEAASSSTWLFAEALAVLY